MCNLRKKWASDLLSYLIILAAVVVKEAKFYYVFICQTTC